MFQQDGSARHKIEGIEIYGRGIVIHRIYDIRGPLPPIIDQPEEYLPDEIDGDLVLDFLRHPDISEALAKKCRSLGIPVVATGKKLRVEGVFTPPT